MDIKKRIARALCILTLISGAVVQYIPDAKSSCSDASCSGDASITISGGQSASQTASLNFGTFIPSSRSGSSNVITISHVDGTRSIQNVRGGNGTAQGDTFSRGIFLLEGFTCSGNGGADCSNSNLTVTMDTSASLSCQSNCGSGAAAISIALTAQGGNTPLPVVEGNDIRMYVGGEATIPANQAAGVYSGNYNISFSQQ